MRSLLVASCLILNASPALALSYGGWNARISLDTYYDDNLSRGTVVSATALPNGNQDLGLNMGLSVGNVFLLSPELDTWILASASGRAGALYPALSGAWGSLYANTVWHLGARDAYFLLGTTRFLGQGGYHAGECGLVQPLWSGANTRLQLGGGMYASDRAEASFRMPSLGGGFDQAYSTGTLLALRYAYQGLYYADRLEPRHQLYLMVTQRLGAGWEGHAQWLRTINVSESAPYQENYVGVGMGYDF